MGKSLYAAGTASPKGFDVATEGRRVVKDAAALAGAAIILAQPRARALGLHRREVVPAAHAMHTWDM